MRNHDEACFRYTEGRFRYHFVPPAASRREAREEGQLRWPGSPLRTGGHLEAPGQNAPFRGASLDGAPVFRLEGSPSASVGAVSEAVL